MPTIQIHYDGWLSLPEEARQHLALVTGSRLQVELIDGGVILRPASQSLDVPATAKQEPVPAVAKPVETGADAAAPKRGPGRPSAAVPQPLLPRRKIGGRKKAVPPDTDPA